MYAISVQQPFSWAILRKGKSPENRRNKRGAAAARAQFNKPGARVALHAGLRYADLRREYEAKQLGLPTVLDLLGDLSTVGSPHADTALTFGAFIGMVTIESVHIADECYDPANDRHCSPWAEPNAAHLVLTDPLVLHRPVSAPGRLGIWSIEDTHLLAEIRRQTA